MSNSDHKKPSINIVEYLPEVYRSDVNQSLFGTSFDRHLTKDDSSRVAGFIGVGNPGATVNRQVQEDTPHRQAYQLAPTMVSKLGTETSALSFTAFTSQLELMGVDVDRMQKWGDSLKFNWVPPINIDMLVNYGDYYWVSANRSDAPQYFTIESACTKAQSQANAFKAILTTRGSTFLVKKIDYVNNQFIIDSQMADVIETGLVFSTISTSSQHLSDDWTVDVSSYDGLTNETTITLIEPIATVQATAPTPSTIGEWWFDTTNVQLKQWSGVTWVVIPQNQNCTINLESTLSDFENAALCACDGTVGWDTTRWDTTPWDEGNNCVIQIPSPWSEQNHWVHKSQIVSTTTAKRASVPILEYSSQAELNSWVQRDRVWKYRVNPSVDFTEVNVGPSRIELEPIKGYVVDNSTGVWRVYLYSKFQTVNQNIDYTKTFVPGYQFIIKDDLLNTAVYTVARSEYREMNGQESGAVNGAVGTGVMVTVVELVESTFSSPVNGGGSTHIRIEPRFTSRGDAWGGYHVHWLLDEAATQMLPTSSHPLNVFVQRDLETDYQYFAPGAQITLPTNISLIAVGNNFQQFTANVPGITQVNLVGKFTYNIATSSQYATAGSDELRVYINGNRQYLTYTEITQTGAPNYTVVGDTIYTGQSFKWVSGITLQTPLQTGDVVRIEVGPIAYEDMGWYNVPVRTIADETAFTLAAASGTQPVYAGLSTYVRQEQQKVSANQYPQFNMYDIVTGEVIGASQLFGFKEDSSYPISSAVQRRIVQNDKDFGFEQYLVDRSNNVMYAYRNTGINLHYWYNPNLAQVKLWNNGAWESDILMTLPDDTLVARTAVVAKTDPIALHDVDRALWMNSTTNELYYRDLATSDWIFISQVTINGSDPTLQTVWRHGLNAEMSVPQYVDKDRNPVPVGDANGSWGVVDQWMYNSEHKNYKEMTLSQLSTHFGSILNAQPSVAGLPGNGAFSLTQSQYNYGLGGTIHNYNYGFDTLISAVNVNNVTPIGVIEFASQEYANNLLFLRNSFLKLTAEMFTDTSTESLVDLNTFAANVVINAYETNDYFARVYSDSSSYNEATGKGVRNWVATAPMFGLAPIYEPHLNVLNGFIEVFHHDGHRTQAAFTAAEQDAIARIICNTPDARVTNGKFGLIKQTLYPLTTADFITQYGVPVRTGVYWYRIFNGTRTLYRFTPIAIVDVDPSTAGVPEGAKYYNTSLEATFELQSGAWVQVTTTGVGDIGPLWEPIDLSLMLGQTYYEVDKRLYEATPIVRPAFNYDSLVVDSSDQAVYDDLYYQRFMAYVASHDIRTPFVNTTYNASNAFSWNYKQSIVLTPPASIVVEPCASWQELYSRWYNTPYPNLEPWCIQGYVNKPTWWDAQYADATNSRLWTSAMWTNLLNRVIPAGKLTPSGAISTGATDNTLVQYTYFSVDTTTDTLLPPYFSTTSTLNRSLFNDHDVFPPNWSDVIIVPDADYSFGDVGPAEWEWMISPQYPYDDAVIAFQMQPVKFLFAAFGLNIIEVDRLQVDTTFKQVYSHEDAMFHGDLYNTNVMYEARGLNQWYVNFNRYTNTDTNGEFRELWAGWDPKLTHQFGGIIDTSTFEISNNKFDIIGSDYDIVLSNTGVINDMWLDAFEVSLVNIAPAIVQYNNQAAWKMEIDSLSAVARPIPYYGVKAYPYNVDPVTDTFTAFNYAVVGSNNLAKRFYVAGDQTDLFSKDRQFTVTLSVANNGTYTVMSSVFEPTVARTRINVVETVASNVGDGVIDLIDVELPWQSGEQIVLSSSKFLPAPFEPDTPYFVIRTGARTFRLAEDATSAITNTYIDVLTRGDGTQIVAELASSFFVFGGNGNSGERWYHYALDKSVVRSFTPPHSILGMQTLINMIDGFAAYQRDTGLLIGTTESLDVDPDTGRTPDWAVETERFINWAYGLRSSRLYINDAYPVVADTVLDTLTFTAATPIWRSGVMVAVRTTGTLPTPLLADTPYYVVTTGTPGVIKLSISADPQDTSSIVNLTSAGSGTITIGMFDKQRAYPRFEMNPSRNSLYIKTPEGVLSDVIEGPYSDIRIKQTIFDQYGRPMDTNQLMVFRQDLRSQVVVRPELPNDVDKVFQNDPYNYIHLGGAHYFVEGYEHYLLFNDYTTGGALVYDQFFGLMTPRFEVDYFEAKDFNLRPTLGGYYLIDGKFERNIEGTTTDVANYYDTLGLIESTEVARRSRALLGYKGRSDYLNQLGVNSKSQFLFYKGMIQTKGSINSVKAFTNSRHFVDATLDEFWAYKLADFGDRRIKVYPEIKLFSSDGLLDDVRLQFLANSDIATDPEFQSATDKGFQLVSYGDNTRWNNFPQQREEIGSPLFLDAEVSTKVSIYSGIVSPVGQTTTIDYWLDTTNSQDPTLYARNNATGQWDIPVKNVVSTITVTTESGDVPMLYIHHAVSCDDVRAIRYTPNQVLLAVANIDLDENQFDVAGNVTATFRVGGKLLYAPAIGNTAVYTVTAVQFDSGVTTITVSEPITGSGGNLIIEDLSNYTADLILPGTGPTEYDRINSESVRFAIAGFTGIVTIFTINPAKAKINPAKLIDTKNQTVVQQVPLWHPAKGYHSTVAIHNVDLQHSGDPAFYEFTPNSEFITNSGNFWNQNEVGTTWLDTSYLNYVPYYDDIIYPDVNDRLYNWGRLSPWGDVKVYQWVESTVPPDQWSTLVQQQTNDTSIAQNDRASGTARQITMKRTRISRTVTIDTLTGRLTSSLPLVDGDQILFTTNGTLPTGIESGTKYTVVSVLGTEFSIIDPVTEDTVEFADAGVGTQLITPAFVATDWKKQALAFDRLMSSTIVQELDQFLTPESVMWPYTVRGFNVGDNSLLAWTPTDYTVWDIGSSNPAPDVVDVYVNGILVDSNLTVKSNDIVLTPTSQLYVEMTKQLTIKESDIVDIVRPIHDVTQTEAAFNPDASDDGTIMVQWKNDYEYSLRTVTTGGTNSGSVTTTLYYFWVEGMTTRKRVANASLSTFEVENQLRIIPTSYMVVQRPADDPYLIEKYGYGLIPYGSIWSLPTLPDSAYQIPLQYRQAVIRKVASYLTDDDRFIIRFTRDWTLRDDIEANGRQINLKNKHAEWLLFRREQTGRIPQVLWQRMTEAVAGYLIDNLGNKVAVPLLERTLYDAQYGTDTQYGLGPDQAFVNKEYGLATILAYLEDPTNDFTPINVDAFFATNDFTTPEGITSALDQIYNTFPIAHVNGMWFETLSDALATKSKYKELLKTSWVALHGTRQLDVNGFLDD